MPTVPSADGTLHSDPFPESFLDVKAISGKALNVLFEFDMIPPPLMQMLIELCRALCPKERALTRTQFQHSY
jgi:hypothetical protein